MILVKDKITKDELLKIANEGLSEIVKAVVDVEKEIMVLDAEFHSDEEMFLLDNGSLQENLWGINIYPNKKKEEWIEFDSLINIRPKAENRSRGVEDVSIRNKIIQIVNNLIQ